MKKTKSKTPSMQGAKQNKTHIIAGCGVLTAVAAVLQFLRFAGAYRRICIRSGCRNCDCTA